MKFGIIDTANKLCAMRDSSLESPLGTIAQIYRNRLVFRDHRFPPFSSRLRPEDTL